MSKMIERLIAEMVDGYMVSIKKMKKSELLPLLETLMKDNLRECNDDTIIDLYEEQFNTYLNVR
jgi:hypothetical protein